jgi:signal peptidase I
MAPRSSPHDEDDEEGEPDAASDVDEEDEESPRRRPPRRSTKGRAPPHPWRSVSADEEEDEEPRAHWSTFRTEGQRSVFYRARDSLYFEPLVALAIIVVVLAGLFAYTQNFPPMYVVESDSMQHGSVDMVGLINTGDLVLAQKVSLGQVTTYISGMSSGYSTYGEYGDVLLYYPNGDTSLTPIIHRAILYLEWDPRGFYDIPQLGSLPCGNATNRVYTVSTPSGCGTTGLTGTLSLYNIGWKSSTVSVPLEADALGNHSGFLTMGDNNFVHCNPNDCGEADQSPTFGLSTLVEPGWVIGVARGMIPWFGAVKLLLTGNANLVPPQSWEFLGITIAGIILLAFGIHYALRAEGVEDERRKEEEEEERRAAGDADEPSSGGVWHRLRNWRSPDSEEEEAGDTVAGKKAALGRRPVPSKKLAKMGRPKPFVRRSKKPAPPKKTRSPPRPKYEDDA